LFIEAHLVKVNNLTCISKTQKEKWRTFSSYWEKWRTFRTV